MNKHEFQRTDTIAVKDISATKDVADYLIVSPGLPEIKISEVIKQSDDLYKIEGSEMGKCVRVFSFFLFGDTTVTLRRILFDRNAWSKEKPQWPFRT